mmetsp:Transcript_3398/g.12926  ORF Transcript_3398/g.12926 Transcript_3398/m.12926 type:complete len:341 (-) Transcript_3398:18-1040(-)
MAYTSHLECAVIRRHLLSIEETKTVGHNVVPHYTTPAVIVESVVVKLWSNPFELWQTRSRNIWEIVMLGVIAHIECNVIQWAIVGIGVLRWVRDKMLRDEMSSEWVETQSKEETHAKIQHGLPSKQVDPHSIESELNNPIDGKLLGERLRHGEYRSQRINQTVEQHKDELLEAAFHELGLIESGNICVNVLHTHHVMMISVVQFERDTRCSRNWQISQIGQCPIVQWFLESEEMSDFVNGQSENVGEGTPKNPCYKQKDPPFLVHHPSGDPQLSQCHKRNIVLRCPAMSVQFANFRSIFFHNGNFSLLVKVFGIRVGVGDKIFKIQEGWVDSLDERHFGM